MGPLQHSILSWLCEIATDGCERLIRRLQNCLLLTPRIMSIARGDRIALGQSRVDPYQLFAPTRLALRTDNVVRGTSAVRQREVCIQKKRRIGIDIRNLVTRIGQSGIRIFDGRRASKVPSSLLDSGCGRRKSALRCRGEAGEFRTGAAIECLRPEEEYISREPAFGAGKQAAAKVVAEVVVMQRRLGSVEVIACIQCFIRKYFVQIAVILLAARPRHNIYLTVAK